MFVCENKHVPPALSPQPGLDGQPTLGVIPKPFLKWAGGKRALAPLIAELLPASVHRYLEPFAGGGALAMHLAHRVPTILLNDQNEELMATYEAIRDNLPELIEALDRHVALHSEEHFYSVRSKCTVDIHPVEQAARMIYLNKTCFNGLYRVNKSGQFNVPFGSLNCPALYDRDNLFAVRQFLSKCRLSADDYFTFLRREVRAGDVVYLDPPYAPISEYSDFKRYTREQFREENQRELASAYDWLIQIGAFPILSNSCCEFTRSLYGKHMIRIVLANRSINKDGAKRGAIPEILVLPRNPKWL